jgi:hypothetical protein
MRWDSLSHPNLTTLRLRNICFYGPSDTGAEGFIVRHAASLTALSISTCMIGNYENDPNPKISADVLYHFQENLINLKHFTLFPTPGQMSQTKPRDFNYKRFMGGQEYKSLLDHKESEPGTDVEAYESLQNIIKSRRLKEQD